MFSIFLIKDWFFRQISVQQLDPCVYNHWKIQIVLRFEIDWFAWDSYLNNSNRHRVQNDSVYGDQATVMAWFLQWKISQLVIWLAILLDGTSDQLSLCAAPQQQMLIAYYIFQRFTLHSFCFSICLFVESSNHFSYGVCSNIVKTLCEHLSNAISIRKFRNRNSEDINIYWLLKMCWAEH